MKSNDKDQDQSANMAQLTFRPFEGLNIEILTSDASESLPEAKERRLEADDIDNEDLDENDGFEHT
jgi:hypothetical protein